jgi:hypothetical protein
MTPILNVVMVEDAAVEADIIARQLKIRRPAMRDRAGGVRDGRVPRL